LHEIRCPYQEALAKWAGKLTEGGDLYEMHIHFVNDAFENELAQWAG